MRDSVFVIKEARKEDFEMIYPLLQELDNSLSKADWSQLFINHYGGDEDYYGYAVFNGEKAVGFIGMIFSEKLINGRLEKICNLTTWIVKKEYRKKGIGIKLLAELDRLVNDYTLVGLTPAENTMQAYKMFGFKDLDTKAKIVLPIPTLELLFNKCSIESEQSVLDKRLSVSDLKLYHDHLKFKNLHFIIMTKSDYCYFIAKKARRKKLLLAEIHYISNYPLFLKYLSRIRVLACLHLKVFGLLLDERILRGNEIKYSIDCDTSRIFMSKSLDRGDIADNLYTELLLLPINII